MIDRRELMQGNLVKPIGYLYEMKPIEYCIVDGFSDDGVFIDGIRGMGLIDYSEIEPIPITPEWLEKFEGWSFNGNRYAYDLERKWDSPQFRIKCYLPEVYDTEGVLVGVEEYSEGFVRLSHIKYIHQLMNLFYALTGEELQIKEKTN